MIFDLFPWPTRLNQYYLPLLDNSEREVRVIKRSWPRHTDLKSRKGLYSAPSPIQKNYITKFLKVYYKVWCFVAHHPGPYQLGSNAIWCKLNVVWPKNFKMKSWILQDDDFKKMVLSQWDWIVGFVSQWESYVQNACQCYACLCGAKRLNFCKGWNCCPSSNSMNISIFFEKQEFHFMLHLTHSQISIQRLDGDGKRMTISII